MKRMTESLDRYCLTEKWDYKVMRRGLIILREGKIIDAAPVWSCYIGKTLAEVNDSVARSGYLIEPYAPLLRPA